jgi:hypothetical protein
MHDGVSSEMEQLAYFAGTWEGVGGFRETPFSPAFSQPRIRVEGSFLSGHWLVQRFIWIEGHSGSSTDSRGAREAELGLHDAIRVWGYDGVSREFVSEWFDSKGRRATVTSVGWVNDRLVTSSAVVLGDREVEMRETFTRTGDHEWCHLGEINTAQGWRHLDEQSFRRVGAAAKLE